MSTKHFFPSTDGIVVQGLTSLTSRNTHMVLDKPNKVIYDITHPRSKVTVISGGGSGHEPAWSGYVGAGMLSAAVNGEVFASPSARQVSAAIAHVPSDAGTILCITNYTGDNLHFGLAREKHAQQNPGAKIAILKMTDDVALGREQTKNTGRRGLAANMWVLKLCGSAAQAGLDFETCFKLGSSVNANAVTVGSSLDHCHIPGREHHRSVAGDTVVLGMGIHNEPGLREISPQPDVEALVRDMLKYCLDSKDKDRAFVEFRRDDAVLLLINNFGGISNFELEALTSVVRAVLEKDWAIVPERLYVSAFETSLNAQGWSLSLLNVSGIERETATPVSHILELLDAETEAPAWPRNGYRPLDAEAQKRKDKAARGTDPTTTASQSSTSSSSFLATPLDQPLRAACEAAKRAEPELTKWDIEMGDGDCGEAVVAMSRNVLDALDKGLCSGKKKTSLFTALAQLGDAVEEVGGSLAAIVGIYLQAFSRELEAVCSERDAQGELPSQRLAAEASSRAISNLKTYTSAREGGRTVMDALLPFGETFERTGDFRAAVGAAEKGAKGTGGMRAKFGRASYVAEGEEEGGDDVPDPGAMAAAIFLRGLVDGWGF